MTVAAPSASFLRGCAALAIWAGLLGGGATLGATLGFFLVIGIWRIGAMIH